MKIMPEVQEAMIRAGYRTPDENPLACRNCPSVTRKKDPRMTGCFVYSSRFYCRRHHFYVHSLGYCPDFGKVLVESLAKKPPFKQGYLFK